MNVYSQLYVNVYKSVKAEFERTIRASYKFAISWKTNLNLRLTKFNNILIAEDLGAKTQTGKVGKVKIYIGVIVTMKYANIVRMDTIFLSGMKKCISIHYLLLNLLFRFLFWIK